MVKELEGWAYKKKSNVTSDGNSEEFIDDRQGNKPFDSE